MRACARLTAFCRREAVIHRMIDAADEERLRAFGTETVVRLTRDNKLLGSVSRRELDGNAWQALNEACRHVLTAGPAELRRHLAQIDAGVLTDGDMDGILFLVVTSLDRGCCIERSHRSSAEESSRQIASGAIDDSVCTPLAPVTRYFVRPS